MVTTESYEVFEQGIYRKNKDGEIVFGKSLPIFINNQSMHLTELKIFQDGKIDCWGGLISFEEFIEKVRSGWIKTRFPSGSDISIYPLGAIKTEVDFGYIEEDELIKEVQDIMNELKNKPSTSELCVNAYRNYEENPSQENKDLLREAYINIPKHNRCYVFGDMNNKDYAILAIIGQVE